MGGEEARLSVYFFEKGTAAAWNLFYIPLGDISTPKGLSKKHLNTKYPKFTKVDHGPGSCSGALCLSLFRVFGVFRGERTLAFDFPISWLLPGSSTSSTF
jgi:hypothetical protein